MPIGQADYQIKLKSEADLEAIEKAIETHEKLNATLERNIATLERLHAAQSAKGGDTGDIDSMLGAKKAALAESQAILKSLGVSAGAAEGKTRELREGIKLLGLTAGDALGPIGELTHFISNPYMLAIAGAVLAIKMLNDAIEENAKRMMANVAYARESAQAQVDAINDVRRANESADADYQRRMAHALDSEDKMAEAMARRLAAFNAEKDAQKAIADIEDERIDKFIKMMIEQGKLSKDEGSDIKAHMKQAAEDRAEKTEETKAQRKIDEEAQLKADDEAKLKAQANLPHDLREQNKGIAKRAETIGKNITQEQKEADKIEADALKAEQEVAERKYAHMVLANPSKFSAADVMAAGAKRTAMAGSFQTDAEAETKANGLRAAVKTATAHIKSQTDTQQRLNDQIKDNEAKASQTESENERLKKAISDLAKTIEDETKALASKREGYAGERAQKQRNQGADKFFAADAEGHASAQSETDVQTTQGKLAKTLDDIMKQATKAEQSKTFDAIHAALERIHAIMASATDISDEKLKKLEAVDRRLSDLEARQKARRDGNT